MRGVRHPVDAPAAAVSAGSLAGVLTEVAGELRAIRRIVEAGEDNVPGRH